MNIQVYIKEGCPWCIELESFLKEKGVKYEAIEVRNDPEQFSKMKMISGQDKAPTVVIDGEFFADTDKEEIEEVLKEKGLL